MIGLNWALFVAGVPTTVVSRWKVEAARRNGHAGDLYKRLDRGGSMASALRAVARNPGGQAVRVSVLLGAV
jgi:CHAT domain-containing protein